MSSYYDILGIGKNANEDEIKRAFRKKAHEYHPDKTGGSDVKFKEINKAYQTLGNPELRKKYDQFGPEYERMGAGAPGGGFGGFDFGNRGGDGIHFDFGDISEMFGAAFGGGRRAPTEDS